METSDNKTLFGESEGVPEAGNPEGRGSIAHQPLAARMRPQVLGDIVGQEHLTKEGSLLPRLISTDRFGSLLFYGPPGCGKTSFAEVIARETKSRFVRINAVMSNVAELREILGLARKMPEARTLLFIDELHRFNKAQQDALLGAVESGDITLIGATTENPSFSAGAAFDGSRGVGLATSIDGRRTRTGRAEAYSGRRGLGGSRGVV